MMARGRSSDEDHQVPIDDDECGELQDAVGLEARCQCLRRSTRIGFGLGNAGSFSPDISADPRPALSSAGRKGVGK
jgi:hypothetical protein